MPGHVKDNTTFVTLLQVAQDDPATRRRLLAILSLEQQMREMALRTFLSELQGEQRPPEFVEAVSYLLSENVSARVLDMLRQELHGHAAYTESAASQILLVARTFLAMLASAGLAITALWCADIQMRAAGVHIPALAIPLIGFIAVAAGGLIGALWIAHQPARRFLLILAGELAAIVVLGNLASAGATAPPPEWETQPPTDVLSAQPADGAAAP